MTHFRRHGYRTFGAGKIYHGGFDRQDEWDDYYRERSGRCKLLNETDGVGGIKFSPVDCGDEGLPDHGIASYGIEQLQRKHDKPFFLLWEEPTRAPLIWVAPGVTKAGTHSVRTVDFMSIYPTLADLCGLPVPKHVEGVSIKKLLAEPNTPWTGVAQTTHGFRNHAVRTPEWRYIRYVNGDEELYDETTDPYEWNNLARDSRHAGLKAELAKHFPKLDSKPGPRSTNARGNQNRR